MKNLWLDVETTGLDPIVNGIVQVAMIIEEDGTVLDGLNLKMNPKGRLIEQEALGINGITVEEIWDSPDWREVYPEIVDLLVDYGGNYRLCGQNVGFDLDFMESYFTECSASSLYTFKNYIRRDTIDTLSVVRTLEKIGAVEPLKKHNLGYMCNHFGIELKNSNDRSFRCKTG